MSLGISTLGDDDQLRFYDITANMDSYQAECLGRVLGIKAKEFSEGDVASDLGKWIQVHVLQRQENYCNLLQQALAEKRKPKKRKP
jgi:hypothetical protein